MLEGDGVMHEVLIIALPQRIISTLVLSPPPQPSSIYHHMQRLDVCALCCHRFHSMMPRKEDTDLIASSLLEQAMARFVT